MGQVFRINPTGPFDAWVYALSKQFCAQYLYFYIHNIQMDQKLPKEICTCFFKLVEAGADLRMVNNCGNTVIHTACLNDNNEALPLLLELSKDLRGSESTSKDIGCSPLVEVTNNCNQVNNFNVMCRYACAYMLSVG